MPEQTLSENLACHHLALQLNEIPAAVVEAVKLYALDSLGCLLAGSRLETGKSLEGRQFLQPLIGSLRFSSCPRLFTVNTVVSNREPFRSGGSHA